MKKSSIKIVKIATFFLFAVAPLVSCATTEDTAPEECEHKWNAGTVVEEPKCEENGKKEFVCELCGEKREDVVPAIGHKYGDGVVTLDPKCEEHGTRTFTCEICDNVVTEDINAIGHEFATEGHVTKEPTCTEEGIFSYPCVHEGCTKTKDEPIDALGHKDENHDGICDACEVFYGSTNWNIEKIVYEDGPWVAGPQNTVLYWSYKMDESSGSTSILSLDNETVYEESTSSVLADFSNSCKASEPDGAYVIHFPMENLIKDTKYTLVFYAKTDGNFTGNLNKMLNNDNFGNNMTCKNLSYDYIYDSNYLNEEGWHKVVVNFTANPFANDGTCQFRIACDVGLEGWKGKLWLSGFTIYDAKYYENINKPADGLHHININGLSYVEPWTIGNEGVSYWNYDLSDNGAYNPFSIDNTLGHGDETSSIKVTFDPNVTSTNGEYVLNITMANLEADKEYVLNYYAKKEEDFTGHIQKQLNNDTLTDSEHPTCAESKILTGTPVLTTEWQKVSIKFKAVPHPEKALCSWQVAYNVQTGFSGTMYFSDFTVETLENYNAGLNRISTENISLARPWEITHPGITHWTNFDDGEASTYNPFSVTDETYYEGDSTSIKATFDSKFTSPDRAYFLEVTMGKVESGKKYKLSYYAKKNSDFTGHIKKQLNNDNFTLDGQPSCVNPTYNTEIELTEDRQKVEVVFTAAPHPDKELCSWRIAFDVGTSGFSGTMYFSNFIVEEIA